MSITGLILKLSTTTEMKKNDKMLTAKCSKIHAVFGMFYIVFHILDIFHNRRFQDFF
jgi:hypothetical protein